MRENNNKIVTGLVFTTPRATVRRKVQSRSTLLCWGVDHYMKLASLRDPQTSRIDKQSCCLTHWLYHTTGDIAHVRKRERHGLPRLIVALVFQHHLHTMDDLLDLDWSSKQGSQGPKQTLQPTQTPKSNANNTAFDFLAKSSGPNYYSTSSTPLRPSTPQTAPLPSQLKPASNGASTHTSTRASTPQPRSQGQAISTNQQADTQNNSSNSTDAFSSLFSLSSASSTNHKMSLAERQAQIAEEKRKQVEQDKERYQADGSFWDNLGSGSASTPASAASPKLPEPVAPRGPSPLSSGLGDLLSPTVAPIPPTSAAGKAQQPLAKSTASSRSQSTVPWDDEDDFLSASMTSGQSASTRPSKAVTSTQSDDPFDFDALQSSINASSSSRSRVNEDAYGDGADDTDDLLGELGRPSTSRIEVSVIVLSGLC